MGDNERIKAIKKGSSVKLQRSVPFFVVTTGLMFLIGCFNPYRDHYLSTIQKWPAAVSERVLPPNGDPQIVSSANMKTDAHHMLQYGYVLLGKSEFQGHQVDEGQALDQARLIGAWVVMVSNQYVGTKTVSVPIVNWTPATTTTTVVDIQKYGDGGRPPREVQKVITQTNPGQMNINYVPEDVDYYKYAATYWAKTKPSPFGVLVRPLTDAEKQIYQTNLGVVVKVVVEQSPAFLANVLEGDVLTGLVGESITSVEQFYDIVNRNLGKSVSLDLIRNGQPLSLSLQLGNE